MRSGEHPGKVDDAVASERPGHRSAPLEPGVARPVLGQRGDAGLKVLRPPYLGLDRLHLLVGGGNSLGFGDRHEFLYRRQCHGRPVGQLPGERHRRRRELGVGHDPVDDVPALEGARVKSTTQHRHLLGARRAGPLRHPLHGTHQRGQAYSDLDRAQLGRFGRDHEIAGQGQLQPAAHAYPVHARHDGHGQPIKGLQQAARHLLIDGKWVEAVSGKTFVTTDPATGEEITRVAHGEAEDIDRAVAAARRAFEDGPWRTITPSARGQIIWRLADLLEQHADEFAELEALDNSKPLRVAQTADVPLAVDLFRYMAGWATKIEGNTIPLSVPGTLAYTLMEPVDVVGQIIPWNFPLLMAAWKLGPALTTGCTVVLKPAEQTPLS